MTIDVQGEKYRTPQELRETIVELEAQLETLGEGTQEHRDLSLHLSRLNDALGAYLEGDDHPPGPVSGPQETPPDSEEEEAAAEGAARAEAAGETASLDSFPCPLCDGTGELAVDPPTSPAHARCSTCDGWGNVMTGSRIPENAQTICPDCEGRGWRSPLALPPVQTQTPAAAPLSLDPSAPLPDWAAGPVPA